MDKQYSIREVSAKFNLPASTLRYYEEVGIFEISNPLWGLFFTLYIEWTPLSKFSLRPFHGIMKEIECHLQWSFYLSRKLLVTGFHGCMKV